MATIMHFVTNDGQLGVLYYSMLHPDSNNAGTKEELLIDFKEIQGAHSGENLAALL